MLASIRALTIALALSGFAAAQDCSVPDMFEPNNDCGTALPIGGGTYPGLNVEFGDPDFFEVSIEAGAALGADILFDRSLGEVDLYLWAPGASCGTAVSGPNGPYLELGQSFPGGTGAIFANTTNATLSVLVEVVVLDAGVCNEYELFLAFAQCSCGQGIPFCQANANSTGVSSFISAFGSSFVADNDLTLSVDSLPANAACLFIVSDTQGFVPNPAGSAGNLCLGGGIGRFAGPGQIMSSGPTGTVSLPIDLTRIPSPSGPQVTASGDTWNFQLWHRDLHLSGVPTSNFSNGLSITFQ